MPKRRHASIARLMVLTLFLAVDFAVFRAAFIADETDLFGETTTTYEMTLMFGGTLLLAQIAIFLAIFGGPHRRVFSISLVASSLAIVAVLGYAILRGLPVISPLWMRYYDGWHQRIAGLYPEVQGKFLVGQLSIGAVGLALYLALPQLALALITVSLVSVIVKLRSLDGPPRPLQSGGVPQAPTGTPD